MRRRIFRDTTPDPADVSGDVDFTPELNLATEMNLPKLEERRSRQEGDGKDDESSPSSTVGDANETAQGSSQRSAPVSSQATSD